MLCPKCLGKTRVINTYNNIKENETYRHRICANKKCGYKFYTVEFTVEENDNFNESLREAIRRK